MGSVQNWITHDEFSSAIVSNVEGKRTELCRMQKEKELNDFQRIPLEIEIVSNLRFDSLEIRDTSNTRVTNKNHTSLGLIDGKGRIGHLNVDSCQKDTGICADEEGELTDECGG